MDANMQERVSTYIEQHALLPARGTVVVAFSGGADSLCLLHLLHTLCGPGKRYPEVYLHVAHLNHQLRGEASDQEAITVVQLAQAWSLPYTIGRIDVPALARQEHRSLEDAGRTARYRFLREVAQGQPIAIAHHQDDQVETLMLHWIRGGGIASMVGLQPRQQDIIRPLLSITHGEALAYCGQHSLIPLEDASNSDTRFYRNRIRHDLLPLIESMNASFRTTLLRNAEVMRVDVQWIETQVERAWSDVVLVEHSASIIISVSPMQELHPSIQRHLLRRITSRLSEGQSPLELRHYLLIEQLMQRETANRDVSLDLPNALIVRRDNNTLLFQRQDKLRSIDVQGICEEITLDVPGSVRLQGTQWTAVTEVLPETVAQTLREYLQRQDWESVWRILPTTAHTVYLDAEQVTSCLHIRTRRPGDVLQPLGMLHAKKVQDILIDKHIPRAQRDTLPLFFNAEGRPIWLGGVCVDDRARLTARTQHIVCLKLLL
ncbi:MAG: tRNA lysidine(34) synthetase TilS [Ktedonobacteraceae bacterium]